MSIFDLGRRTQETAEEIASRVDTAVGKRIEGVIKTFINPVVRPLTPSSLKIAAMRMTGTENLFAFFEEIAGDLGRGGGREKREKREVEVKEHEAKVEENDGLQIELLESISNNVEKLLDVTIKSFSKRSTDRLADIERNREAQRPVVVTQTPSPERQSGDDGSFWAAVTGGIVGGGGINIAQKLLGALGGKMLAIVGAIGAGILVGIKALFAAPGMLLKMMAPLGRALVSGIGTLGRGLTAALAVLFSPRALLAFLTKFALPLAIVGSIVSGIIGGFEEFKKSGDLGKAIMHGIGSALDFLTFGLVGVEELQAAFDFISANVNKWIIEPVQQLFDMIAKGFEEIRKNVLLGLSEIVGNIANIITTIGGKNVPGVNDLINQMELQALELRRDAMGLGPINQDPGLRNFLRQEEMFKPRPQTGFVFGDKFSANERLKAAAEEYRNLLDQDYMLAEFERSGAKEAAEDYRKTILQSIADSFGVDANTLEREIANTGDGHDPKQPMRPPIGSRLLYDEPVGPFMPRIGAVDKGTPYGPYMLPSMLNAISPIFDYTKTAPIPNLEMVLKPIYEGTALQPDTYTTLRNDLPHSEANPIIFNNNNFTTPGGQSQANPDIFRHQDVSVTPSYQSNWEKNFGF